MKLVKFLLQAKRISLIGLLLLSGCTYAINNDLVENKPEVVEEPESTVSFAAVNDKVIKVACLSCHSAAGKPVPNQGDVNLETHESISYNKNAIKTEVLNNTMPKNSPPLSASQKKLLLAWLDSLPLREPIAPSPKAVEIPELSTEEIFYDEIARYVFTPNCIKCHDGKTDIERENLSNYAGVFKNRFEIIEQLDMGFMPPEAPKGEPLTDRQKKLIFSWLERGAPEKP